MPKEPVTYLSPGAAARRSRWCGHNEGASDGLVSSADQDSTSPVGRVLDIQGIVVGLGPGDLKALAVGSRETAAARALGNAFSGLLAAVLCETSSNGCVGAEKDGGKD